MVSVSPLLLLPTHLGGERGSGRRQRLAMSGSGSDLPLIMARVAQRDKAAFQQLYQATSAKLYGVILRILVRRSVADEVLQDVFVRIWERAADFQPQRASAITWMATIARNRALDELRRSNVAPLAEMPEGFDMASDLDNALEQIEQSEQLKSLVACLNGLEADKREIVLLAYYRGMSREALAQRYGRPVATVKTWLHRSLAQLRSCLAQ